MALNIKIKSYYYMTGKKKTNASRGAKRIKINK